MFKVIILPLAKEDIRAATFWYEAKKDGLGKKFLNCIRRDVNFIRRNPKATAIRYKNIMTTYLNDFPYLIHYYLNEKEKEIIISAILHTSRNPDIWSDRQ